MTTRWARVARGLVAALCSVFVAAFSHMIAGGAQPNAFALIASLIIATLVCVALTGKRLSRARLALSVSASQFLFHGIFSLWSNTPTGMRTGHLMEHGHMTMGLASASASASQPMPTDDGAMWIGHAVAAVITIAALRYGELAFWELLEIAGLWLGAILFRAPSAPLALASNRVLSPAERVFVPRDLILLLSSMRHRGPPALGGSLALA